jgi:hypothetical protein
MRHPHIAMEAVLTDTRFEFIALWFLLTLLVLAPHLIE